MHIRCTTRTNARPSQYYVAWMQFKHLVVFVTVIKFVYVLIALAAPAANGRISPQTKIEMPSSRNAIIPTYLYSYAFNRMGWMYECVEVYCFRLAYQFTVQQQFHFHCYSYFASYDVRCIKTQHAIYLFIDSIWQRTFRCAHALMHRTSLNIFQCSSFEISIACKNRVIRDTG